MDQDNFTPVTDSVHKKETDEWLQRTWRPLMSFLYMAICAADFIIFPILWAGLHAYMHAPALVQWQPLTLQSGGLIHLAFGAILGVAAYGRTQEKINGVSHDSTMTNTSQQVQVPMYTQTINEPYDKPVSAPVRPVVRPPVKPPAI